ncbi:MAG: TraB/GumN family protein [Pseudomonadota bacterium]|nr:TraB/GumN family protein [Pseudomonadota bacterium]
MTHTTALPARPWFDTRLAQRLLRRACAVWMALLVCVALLGAPQAVARGAGEGCVPALVPPTPEQMRQTAQAAQDRGFLWSIEKGGRTSHLYGTVHLGELAWAVPGPSAMRALAASKVLALELDVTDETVLRELAALVRADLAPALPPALEARLRAAARAECLPWDALAGMRPEFQLSTLTVAVARRAQLEAAFGSEVALTGIARQSGLPVVGLETAAEQVAALAASDAQALADAVRTGLDDVQRGQAQRLMAQLTDAWARSDAARLARYQDWCDCANTPAERAALRRAITDRHPRLVERIDALHTARGPAFVAVGALHMFGPEGLPALLSARGYTVRRVY